MRIKPLKKIHGTIEVPGDKSISHRSIMIGSIANGSTRIRGFLNGKDCNATIRCFRQLGVVIREKEEEILIEGKGLYGLKEPDDFLDVENSGTTFRLLSGILSGQPFYSILTGDRFIRRRPMKRISEPLRLMGAKIDGRKKGEKAPFSIRGGDLHGISYQTSVASAQVKSAILFAGLYGKGVTWVKEEPQSRDHTERMLRSFGAKINYDDKGVGIEPGELQGKTIQIPGDISSAAFFLGAAAPRMDSKLTIKNVGINPTRDGILRALRRMGAEIELINKKTYGEEPVADLIIQGRSLKGITISRKEIPGLIDEIPIIAVVAAMAEGKTRITGAEELRVKESDRIDVMVKELQKLGVNITALTDGMEIEGPSRIKNAQVASHGDHRIAMALSIAGTFSESGIDLEGEACIDVSYPTFLDTLNGLLK